MDDPREEQLRAREGLVRLGHVPIAEALESVHPSDEFVRKIPECARTPEMSLSASWTTGGAATSLSLAHGGWSARPP
jgi:hypothetical protein